MKKILAIVNKWEATGKLFFNRNSDGSMTIFIRDPRLWGGNLNIEHWQNANEVESELIAAKAKMLSGIQIDKLSGNLVIRVKDVYNS